MYCKNCGRAIDENSTYCAYCKTVINEPQKDIEDKSSFWFAILGFFIPLAGLIVFAFYDSKKPKRAKSAAKGAAAGIITKAVVGVLVYVLFYSAFVKLVLGFINPSGGNFNAFQNSLINEESLDSLLENYVDVSFGEFKVSKGEFYSETSIEVTVKNKADKQYSYDIVIEAVEQDGTRIDTSYVYAENLAPGQKVVLPAFEYVEENKISKFKNAEFRVLEIEKFAE